MIVVDASAVLEMLLQTKLGARVEARLFRDGDLLHAPALLDVEVVQALRRLVQREELEDGRAQEAVADLVLLDVIRHQHTELAGRAFALRESLTAYDAVYVALAEALDAALVTCDRPLATAPGHAAQVELLR
jgi:predicted nucleic acid-binding protein